MNIENIAIKDIKPYERNAKKHDERQIKNVMQSIKNYGIVQPLVVDKDNVLIIGHCRLIACKRLGITEVPVVRKDDLTQEDVDKLRLLDNKLNESEWDFDLLLEDVPTLDFSEFDIDWGLPEDIEENTEIEEDEAPEPPEEPKAKLGDLWQLGSHRLICGDSTDVAVIDRLMDGVKADMVFTDPPYGMNLDTDFSKMHSENNHDFQASKKPSKGGNYVQVIGDNEDFDPNLINTIFVNFSYCKEIFVWGADYYAELIPNRNDGSWIVWDKRMNEQDDLINNENAMDKGYGSCFELCYSKSKHKRDIARIKWSGLFGMEKDDTKKRVHPTQKPIKLAGWFLDRYSKEGQVVIDLFGGSGSTLIACEQLNRKCYMAEISPQYIDVIINRYINLKGTDKDVFLLRDGKKIPYNEVE